MAGSVVVAVRTALADGIRTALADPKVSVTYGWQGGDEAARREQVFTNRPRSTHDPASLKSGRNFREEVMDLDIVVLVSRPNAYPQDVDARALEIGTVVEEFIADRKSNELGIPGLVWLRMAGMDLQNMYGAGGSLTEITYTVRYHARLT